MAAKAEAVRTTAKKFGLLALTAFAPPGADGRGHGGVMIVIPHEAIMPPHQPQTRGTQNTTQTQAERKAEEDIRAATDLHARCDAIRATRKASMGGRFVSAKLEVDGQMRTLTSAYAPATPKAGEPISKPIRSGHGAMARVWLTEAHLCAQPVQPPAPWRPA